MNKLFPRIAQILFSALLLSGCGGSGGDTDAEGEVTGNPQVGSTTSLITADSTVSGVDEGNATSTENTGASSGVVSGAPDNELSTDTENSSDNNSDEDTPLAENDTTSNNNDEDTPLAENDTTSNNNDEDTTLAENDTASDSFCAPLNTQTVTYEDYCNFGNGICTGTLNGWFVPQPLSGFSTDNQQLCDASASFGVDTVEVLVPFVANSPDIDGVSNFRDLQWANAVSAGTWGGAARRNDIDNLLRNPVAEYQDGSGYSTWRASHDGVNLYLWVRASNDSVPSNAFSDSERFFNDDSAVVYIDGDNSKGTEYDGINDFVAIMLAKTDDWIPEIQSNSPEGMGIFYRTVTDIEGFDILIYEIAINLESVGIRVGQPFGLDIHINEDDNGGDRDAMWGWFEQSFRDSSWRDPSVLGTLLLTDCEDRTTCGRTQRLR